MHLQALYYISDRMRNEIVLRKCICPSARFSMTGTAGYGIIQITMGVHDMGTDATKKKR